MFMKNLFRTVISLLLVLTLLTPLGMPAYGTDNTPLPTQQMGDLIEPQAVDLITTFCMNAYRDSPTRVRVEIETNCIPTVVRCGVKSLVLQSRKSSSEKWQKSLSVGDFLDDDCVFAKSITFAVNAGTQYRVVGTHYAKKAWYSIQKIEHTSKVV